MATLRRLPEHAPRRRRGAPARARRCRTAARPGRRRARAAADQPGAFHYAAQRQPSVRRHRHGGLRCRRASTERVRRRDPGAQRGQTPVRARRPAGQARRHDPRQLPRHLPGAGVRDEGRRRRPGLAGHAHAAAEPGQRRRRGARRPGRRWLRAHRPARGPVRRGPRPLRPARAASAAARRIPAAQLHPALSRVATRRPAPGRPGADAQGGRARTRPRGRRSGRARRPYPRLHHPRRLRPRGGDAARAAPAALRRESALHLERRVGALPRDALRARPRDPGDRAAARASGAAQPGAVAGQRRRAPAGGGSRTRSPSPAQRGRGHPGRQLGVEPGDRGMEGGRALGGDAGAPARGLHRARARILARARAPRRPGRGRARTRAPHPRRDRLLRARPAPAPPRRELDLGSRPRPRRAPRRRRARTAADRRTGRHRPPQGKRGAPAPGRERVLVELRGHPDHRRG